jgi:hypothetical protein
MVPLPGSPAICAGALFGVLPGNTTDQRGYPLQPIGGYCPSGQGDSGAVQSNYTSIQFVQQPSDVNANTAMSPVPTVQAVETDTLLGSTDAVNGIPVTLTDLSGHMSGGSATSSGGVATFGNLQFSQGYLHDTLSTAAITVTGTDTLPSLTSGTFNVLATATHFAVSAPGNTYPGAPFSVTVTAEDASNSAVPNYTGTVQFSTSDPGSGVALPANYTFTSGTSGDNGSHTFANAVTLITAGNQTVTATDTVTNSITGSATISVEAITPVFTWNPATAIFVGDPGAGVLNASVNCTSCGTITYLAALNGGPASSITSTSGLAPGTYTIGAIFQPSSGEYNMIQRTSPLTVRNRPPVGYIFPVKDATTGGSSTVAQLDTLLVTGTAGDLHDGTPVLQVQIVIDGTVVGNATLGFASPGLEADYNNPAYANGGWRFSYPASGLSMGTHTLKAIATDSLALSTTLGTETFTVGTTSAGPPLGWVDSVKDSTTGGTSTLAQLDTLLVTGTAGDPHDGTPVLQVQILIDGTVVGNAALGIASRGLEADYNNPAYANGGWRFTYPASGLSLGTHTLVAIARDSLGLSTTLGTETFTVATTSAGPPVGWVFPVKDATTGGAGTVALPDNLVITGTAGDPHDGTPVLQVQILIDGTVVGNATLGMASPGLKATYNNPAYANGGWSFTCPASGLSLGTHTLTAIARDSLGLTTTLGTGTFTVTE